MMAHSIQIKVYYEDTDAGGVVYYANYLRYLERARTEFLASKGIDVTEYHNAGFFFVVVRVDIQYRRSAKLGDLLTVNTEVEERRNATLTFRNRICRDNTLLAEALVTISCLGKEGKPVRFPERFASLSD